MSIRSYELGVRSYFAGASVTLDPIFALQPSKNFQLIAAFQGDEKTFDGGLEMILCLK